MKGSVHDLLIRRFHERTIEKAESMITVEYRRFYTVIPGLTRPLQQCIICDKTVQKPLVFALTQCEETYLCSNVHRTLMCHIVFLMDALKKNDQEATQRQLLEIDKIPYDRWAQTRVLYWIWIGRNVLRMPKDVVLLIAKII